MDLLVDECLDVLMDMMDVNNILKIFAVVDKIDHLSGNASDLIIDFMKKNIKTIVEKEDWPSFTSDYTSLVKDFILNINEELNEIKDNKDKTSDKD